MIRKAPKGEPTRWIEQHKHFDGDECLIWPFAKNHKGYGVINDEGATRRVHRIMCEHRHGAPPSPAHQAAHSCGKGHLGCVNKMHLDWKTPKDNHADLAAHGTLNIGQRNGSAKLSPQEVAAIRSARGISQDALAKQFGVTRSAVYSIINGRTWRWL
jgi:hypothetical protein